ncbi:FAD-binding protein [Pseudonocardia spinosispora]|uniref:FAD-binding protein n=1 Tax=Pseudonocardia spinosispora TaxID=103441 RepID=UPI000414ED4A|nr:FAD-binding protein [Pseudonocardia spinosispora]
MDFEAELAADVVVVGLGAAGACAAIEAARAGAEVVVLDRFNGGGASAMSGGIVYAGGGTTIQRQAGVEDTQEAMFEYLRREVGDVVSAETLRRFCDGSVEMIDWLSDLGVPFEASLCPYKTSYPSNRHYLYYSGSEAAGGFRDAAKPAPRGHRAHGRGISGKVLYDRMADALRALGVRVLTQTAVKDLVTDDSGRVVGVECRRLTGKPAAKHRRLSKYAAKPGVYAPPLRKRLNARAEAVERQHARPLRVHARRGVVLAAGGFIENREMMRRHAPAFRGGLPLGTSGDDGSGIRLGESAGGATAELDSVSVWRFISPPSAFLGSLLVDAKGRRICDESRYGAALGHAMVTEHEGRGWLMVDADLVREVRRQIGSQTVWFQRMQTEYLLRSRRVSGVTVEEVAAKAGVDAEGLRATVEAHNAAAAAGLPDPAGKPAEFVRPMIKAPFALLDIAVGPSMLYPCPMLTLGGLRVNEETGAVLRSDGEPVAGLFAAGRTAVGICSRSYVSGLSLADCIFSGRRAGRHVQAASGLDTNKNVF